MGVPLEKNDGAPYNHLFAPLQGQTAAKWINALILICEIAICFDKRQLWN
jgi:hypothetical protein